LALYPETRLYFAGEATHRDDAYTVHGAFLSGDREARRIATWWRRYRDDA
jgi:monoamine oxidase